MTRGCTKERFIEDTKDHKLTIKKDDGFYRHLHLSSGSSDQYYEIITYPNGLIIRGDMGSYVFERLEDMFCFFRDGKDDYLGINTGYWAEKVTSESMFGNGVREFSPEVFREHVKEEFDQYYEDTPDDDLEKMFVWEEIEDQVLSAEDSEWDCVSKLNDFDLYPYKYFNENEDYITIPEGRRFDFGDFWECSCNEKTYNYVWCLYAIVLAVRMYDEA